LLREFGQGEWDSASPGRDIETAMHMAVIKFDDLLVGSPFQF
jgi:hypothetical protein